jgi:hypothetical protein
MKKKNSDPTSGINIPDPQHWDKILKFFDADPESFSPWIRDTKNSDPRYGINIPDPQHWVKNT